MKKLLLLPCFSSRINFSSVEFDVVQCDESLTIALDEANYVVITLKNQQVAYKSKIMGGFSFSEQVVGKCNYKSYFRIEWPDDQTVPELVFLKPPIAIQRKYHKGMNIEFGIEDVLKYRIIYQDKVTAEFRRINDQTYKYNYSTGFEGKLSIESDGSHIIRFKGVTALKGNDGHISESKFILSRSKYTDNLILILQDDATVYLLDS
jgi:hypothetical protein